MILSQNCIDFYQKTNRFGHISVPSYRGSTCWLAGWLGGPPNASNLRVWMPYRKLWGAFRSAESPELEF